MLPFENIDLFATDLGADVAAARARGHAATGMIDCAGCAAISAGGLLRVIRSN